jgi:hypothetical protein
VRQGEITVPRDEATALADLIGSAAEAVGTIEELDSI